ncbi:MAG: PH domain-containing protein [Muribaculaceae bacterium]|nr:PH domain-containing protein [Muribaculaceae bacterium]
MKHAGTCYNSMWDSSTWLMIIVVLAVCTWPIFVKFDIATIIIAAISLLFIFTVFIGIYYRIDGNKLIIYQFFMPTAFPIDKIAEIRPTKSMLSSPATSLTRRLAIKFSDRKILKSTTPLIISPAHQKQFIAHLLSLNPNIKVYL